MFDKETIEKLEQANALEQVLSTVKAQNPAMVTAAPKDIDLLDLEKYMPNKRRLTVDYKTKSINSFAEYVKAENLTGDSKLFIDDESLIARCVFDLGNAVKPLHQCHRGELRLKRTPLFQALLEMNERKFDQKQAGEFLEDWAHAINVVWSADNSSMTTKAAIQGLYNLTIDQARSVNSTVSDFGYEASALEKVEAKSKTSMPARVVFTGELYSELSAMQVELRVSILTGESKPLIKFRIVALDKVTEQCAADFKEKLDTLLNGVEIKSFIGMI